MAAREVVEEVRRVLSLSRSTRTYRQFPPVVRSALEESCWLHVKKLQDFFYGAGDDPGRVLAADYFSPPWSWESDRPELRILGSTGWREKFRDLTMVRSESAPDERPVPAFTCDELAMETMDVVVAFLGALPDHRARWFQGLAPPVTDFRPS